MQFRPVISAIFSGMSLKEEQLSAIKAIYERRNVFVCFPNGKSLCYKTLPFVMDELGGDRDVIIVSMY